jgi:rhomboid family GlyGly-CTERM serine protease
VRTAGAGTLGRSAAASERSGVFTLGLCALALAASAWPPLPELLQYDRAAVAAGEWWRFLTGHFTHWSAEQLLWDAAVFGALGLWCERTLGKRFLLVLLVAAPAIAAAVWLGSPEISLYRGLSGLDSALFALAAVTLAREASREKRWLFFAAAAVFLAGFCGKTAFEAHTMSTLFVDSARAGFRPLPLAHAAGAAAGTLGGWVLPCARASRSGAERTRR